MPRTTERTMPLTELNFRGIDVLADGGGQAVTVYPSDSGVIFIKKEDAGQVIYTLPTVADAKGKMFWFFNAHTTGEIKVSSTAANIIGDASTGQHITSNGHYEGECGFIISDGTNYYWFTLHGTWGSS